MFEKFNGSLFLTIEEFNGSFLIRAFLIERDCVSPKLSKEEEIMKKKSGVSLIGN